MPGKAEETRVPTVPEELRPTNEGGEEMSPAEVHDVMREPDPFEVRNKKEGFEYRWLNRNKHNMSRRQFMDGYEVVQSSDPEEAGIKDADGTRVVGDVVLGRRPIEVGDKRRGLLRERRRLLEGEPTAQFHQAGEAANREARDAGFTGAGITTFETDEAGNDRRPAVRPHRKLWQGASIDKDGNLTK